MPTCSWCRSTVSANAVQCPSCGASVPEAARQSVDEATANVRSLLAEGKPEEAVRHYAEAARCTPAQAEAAVEKIILQEEIFPLLKAGKKLQAVKIYKNRTGLSLLDAKREVEQLAQAHGIQIPRGSGCAGVVLVAVCCSLVVALLAALFRG